jgi:hypothetical protein
MAQEFKYVSGVLPLEYKNVRILSQAYTIGDSVMLNRDGTAKDVIPATSLTVTSNIYGIVMSTQVSGDTTMLIALVRPDQTWSADVTNTAVITDNQQRMVLTNTGTVNNTHNDSTAGIFQQTGIAPQGITTRIVGKFLVGVSAA